MTEIEAVNHPTTITTRDIVVGKDREPLALVSPEFTLRVVSEEGIEEFPVAVNSSLCPTAFTPQPLSPEAALQTTELLDKLAPYNLGKRLPGHIRQAAQARIEGLFRLPRTFIGNPSLTSVVKDVPDQAPQAIVPLRLPRLPAILRVDPDVQAANAQGTRETPHHLHRAFAASALGVTASVVAPMAVDTIQKVEAFKSAYLPAGYEQVSEVVVNALGDVIKVVDKEGHVVFAQESSPTTESLIAVGGDIMQGWPQEIVDLLAIAQTGEATQTQVRTINNFIRAFYLFNDVPGSLDPGIPTAQASLDQGKNVRVRRGPAVSYNEVMNETGASIKVFPAGSKIDVLATDKSTGWLFIQWLDANGTVQRGWITGLPEYDTVTVNPGQELPAIPFDAYAQAATGEKPGTDQNAPQPAEEPKSKPEGEFREIAASNNVTVENLVPQLSIRIKDAGLLDSLVPGKYTIIIAPTGEKLISAVREIDASISDPSWFNKEPLLPNSVGDISVGIVGVRTNPPVTIGWVLGPADLARIQDRSNPYYQERPTAEPSDVVELAITGAMISAGAQAILDFHKSKMNELGRDGYFSQRPFFFEITSR